MIITMPGGGREPGVVTSFPIIQFMIIYVSRCFHAFITMS